MDDLFGVLAKRAEANAIAAVETFVSQIPDYRREAANPRGKAKLLDHALWFRRHTAEKGRTGEPLDESTLAFIGAIGRLRAAGGFTTRSVESALALHTNLMLSEIQAAAAENGDVTELLRLTAWFGAQGLRGCAAYLNGYLDEHALRVKLAQRVRDLAESLLANATSTAEIAHRLSIDVHPEYFVAVLRFTAKSIGAADEIIEAAFKQHSVVATWHEPGELVALLPVDHDRALAVVREMVALGRVPCAVGAATGRAGALAAAAEVARRVADVAPPERVPSTLYGIPEVFVELGVAGVPEIDHWLGELVRRLAGGPELVATLDAYYRNDMNRLGAALALHIHPRTLDYRLRRVRELVGVDPGSVRGVRILSSAVARAAHRGCHR
ncbi:helix-turn-helix domain-containing protein [Amycolatopsis sp. 195334CR]|uniref:helix-turn-helix domain-containing protein n=1 Tax=Amycolatopsis sp. 195334CR TaxID=2814588 RepID=UPI001A8E393D|nr:helix-turn-helix domain-containing protein [Amycolatopsis sp. 195334CR]MBN6040997.1 helix-turn-helix domain-containing protein [Amycolatopsis sp. 195334CR]